MKYKTLSFFAKYSDEKITPNELLSSQYISTENMLPDKGGITGATALPKVQQIKSFKKNDILISNIRPYFKKIWKASFDGGCSNDVLIIRTLPEYDSTFLYYALSSDNFFSFATKTAKGTKMPRGDKQVILNYKIPFFTRNEQEKIGSILSNIDQKIHTNKRINDNLQQQAQVLFKEWFIDNSDAPLWRKGTFSDLIEKTVSGDWGKDTPSLNNTEMVYCIRGADIPEIRAGNKGKMPTRYILPKNYAAKQLVNGDIVVEISGGSPMQSTGRVAAVSSSLLARYDKGMVCTNFCKALKPITGYSMYVYHYWQYLYDLGVFFSYENGTTGIKNLDIRGFIETEPIMIAPAELIKKFDAFCQSICSKIYSNGLENEQLVYIRDSLIPKLISGELDVSKLDI